MRTRLCHFPCLTGKILGFLAILTPIKSSRHRKSLFLLMFSELSKETQQGKLISDQGINNRKQGIKSD